MQDKSSIFDRKYLHTSVKYLDLLPSSVDGLHNLFEGEAALPSFSKKKDMVA